MTIISRANYHKDLNISISNEHNFKINSNDRVLEVYFKKEYIEVVFEHTLPEALAEKITSSNIHSKLSFTEAREKYAEILGNERVIISDLLKENKKIIDKLNEVVSFCLNSKIESSVFVDITDFYVSNKVEYRLYPDLNVSTILDLSFVFTDTFAQEISSYITDESKKPLLAFSVLRNSLHQENLRQRWIEITVAAELGIKEFFVRKFPSFEMLINEMPSPNIKKMYGSLLEHYIGEKAPNLNFIQKGLEIRNSLVHSFSEQKINASMSDDYTKAVKECLIFLQIKLTGEDCFTSNQITFGEMEPTGIYSGQVKLTKEQYEMVSKNICTGIFKAVIY
ncbi:hypothetical protein [Pectobacterium carotovorum]|uniref:hypothetical protein n=1 Tax=Pectobacterium carotovorum TaxID=554 RepID=UPI00068E78AF|nr:hypothetical protein [Pectobacterium carotovorum]